MAPPESVETALPPGSSVIVISGPGGVGKGTLVAELLKRDPRLWLSRSWTTRERRPGEAPDAYHFVTPGEFEAHAANGGFVEWAQFLDYRQGSPVPSPPSGVDVVFEIDVQGAQNLVGLYTDILLVFIDTPSREVQEARLRGRGDHPDRISQRMIKADEERSKAAELDYRYVINDDLDRAVEELHALINKARSNESGDYPAASGRG